MRKHAETTMRRQCRYGRLLKVAFLLTVSILLAFAWRLTFKNAAAKYPLDNSLNQIYPHKGAIHENQNRIHIVVMFYKLLDSKWVSDNFPKTSKWDDRMAEITECIKRNLNHTLVGSVNFLYPNVAKMRNFLDDLILPHREKLFVHEYDAATVADFMRFASDHLQGRIVMILSSDNFIGEGFEQLDFPYLRNNQVVYALTRNWVACPNKADESFTGCGEGALYVGSHEGYLFNMRQKLPEKFLNEINIEPTYYGIDSRVIGAFHYTLNHTVLNPCKILKIIHLHCSGVRAGSKLTKLLDHGPHNKLAPFSGLYITNEKSKHR